jgi:hypothetical protein
LLLTQAVTLPATFNAQPPNFKFDLPMVSWGAPANAPVAAGL